MADMTYRPLGSSGLMVSTVGIGDLRNRFTFQAGIQRREGATLPSDGEMFWKLPFVCFCARFPLGAAPSFRL